MQSLRSDGRLFHSAGAARCDLQKKPWKHIFLYIIQIHSGIACSRVLNGDRYA